MSDLGTVPAGLMRALGSDLFWGVALAVLMGDRSTGEWMIIFPFLSGEIVLGHRVDHGTGSDLSGS